MKYNSNDHVTYCTNTERLALTVANLIETAKYFEVDTGNVYIVYNGAWYQI